MNISIIGTGYVGLIAGACFAEGGHKVICLDVDKEKIALLQKGISPIYEPGLEELLKKCISSGTISFTSDSKEAVENSQIIFIAVGTPQNEKGEANMCYFKEAAEQIGKHMNEYKIIVDKSTVPVGTAEWVGGIIENELKRRGARIKFDVISNPEFLAEGSAIEDFHSERVVIGSESEEARKILHELYAAGENEKKKILLTDTKSAEIIKYASNSMLALRLSFINEVSQLCEKVGANIEDVSIGVGMDERIGPKFLKAGLGYGGSCFPKDIRAFISTMKKNGLKNGVIDRIEEVNQRQLELTFKKIEQLVRGVKGKKIAVLGLAFKANTDDARESPAVKISKILLKRGALLSFFDPKAMDNAKSIFPKEIFAKDAYDAISGCDALLIATDWEEFKRLDLKKIKSLMKEPNVIDGRNIFEPKKMRELGFNYLSIGR
ncbi:UDP-glucose 6-dehydrogenase AglM [uncultured archaeon]|nr:UDP-glucose 6-dehydrogenase AglM [uncultured archaeon]